MGLGGQLALEHSQLLVFGTDFGDPLFLSISSSPPGAVFEILAVTILAVDGYPARTRRDVTTCRNIADKVLALAGLVTSEFLVTGLRILAMGERVVVAGSSLGKAKTLSHIGVVIFSLLTRYFGVDSSGTFAESGVFVCGSGVGSHLSRGTCPVSMLVSDLNFPTSPEPPRSQPLVERVKHHKQELLPGPSAQARPQRWFSFWPPCSPA